MSKTIRFSLDAESVERAAREVERFAEELKALLGELVRLLTEQGAQVASVKVAQLGAVDTGELSDSFIAEYNEQDHIGIIRSIATYAFFVEYGTGIVGAGSPHPDMGGMWTPPPSNWSDYDTNKHGEAGWWYVNKDRDGKLHWTRGMPSRPFFYETYKELEQLAQERFSQLYNG